MNNLKFRAYIKPVQKIVDVLEIDFKNKVATLDIVTKKVYPDVSFWWKETKVSFSSIEIMQSTGFKDKNGKEIFEGDIVSKENEYVVIKSFTGLWKAVSQKDDEKDRELYFLTLADVCEDIEVIGNIYENKEDRKWF